MLNDRIILSLDGSHTIISDKFDVSYHSKHGAISESQIVFLKAGLDYFSKMHPEIPLIKVFEMGFGTGLNTLLSCQYANETKVKVYYESIEAYPIEDFLIKEINYPSLIGNQDIFDLLHSTSWNEIHSLSNFFNFKKHLGKLENYAGTENFDVIFFDAFAPSSQPELWDIHIMEKMFKMLNSSGVLVTYCAKGSFKRTLKEIGFKVESLPGPVGKREITRATKFS